MAEVNGNKVRGASIMVDVGIALLNRRYTRMDADGGKESRPMDARRRLVPL